MLGVLVLTIGISLAVERYKTLYVFGYIMVIAYAMGRRRRSHRGWSAIGIKPLSAFFDDLERVWWLALLVVVILQFLAPEMGVAFLGGHYHELIQYIDLRVSQVPALVGLALILTLVETIVYQACVQERLSPLVGAAAAVVLTSALAGWAHAASAGSGTPFVAVTDAAGVALDFAVFGIIWARTHNLVLTWLVHYAADIAGIVALALIFR